MKSIFVVIFSLLGLSTPALAENSEAFVYQVNGDSPAGAVVVKQGDHALYYECPVVAFLLVVDELNIAAVCSAPNGLRSSAGGLIGDRFTPEQQFVFTQVESRPTRYQYGQVSDHLVESGIQTEVTAVYFDPAKPDWMFKNGITTIVSIDPNRTPHDYSTSGSTYTLTQRKPIWFTPIPAGQSIEALKLEN